jgi:hypothetical protein
MRKSDLEICLYRADGSEGLIPAFPSPRQVRAWGMALLQFTVSLQNA